VAYQPESLISTSPPFPFSPSTHLLISPSPLLPIYPFTHAPSLSESEFSGFSNFSNGVWGGIISICRQTIHPTVTENGLLYFCYWDVKSWSGDIYVSQCMADKCSEPVKMDAPINSDSSDVDPFVGKDGSFMIYASNRPGGYGGHDQYIFYKKADGTWTELTNLGMKFNTPEDDYDMDVSPDGKYLFLYWNGDIYWMKSLDLENPKGLW